MDDNTATQLQTSRQNIESCIIGAILLDPTQLEHVQNIISPSDFDDILNCKFYMTMSALHADGKIPDLILMSDLLQQELPSINVISMLAEIMNATPTSKNVLLYAEQLKLENNRTALTKSLNNIVYLNQTKQPLGDLLDKATKELADISQNIITKKAGFSISSILTSVLNELDDAMDGIKQPKLDTGFEALDDYLQGMRPGQFIVLAARPSQGKTTLALNILHHVVFRQKKHGLLFSLEMGDSEIGRSLISMHGSIPLTLLKDDKLYDNDGMMARLGAAVSQLSDVKLTVVTESTTIGKLKQVARQYKQSNPDLGFIVIDYLQLLSKPKSESRVLEITAITRELKLLAKELQLPILVLSQLNRNAEGRPDKTPILSDLRDSGSIEQDADMVIFIHRIDREAKIVVGKNRSGACGELKLEFDGAIATFKEHKIRI